LTNDKTTAKSKKVSSNKKMEMSGHQNIPNIKQYLTDDFANCNYQNNTLKTTASDLMESLFSEGELKYLRILSSKKTIYREKVFWDQLVKWNIDAFLGVQNAELLLETVVEGFRDRVITFKSMRTGRPPKSPPPDIDIIEEYFKIQQELLKHAIIDYPKKDIDKYCSEVEKGIVSKQNPQLVNVIKENIERRKRNIATFLKEKGLKFSKREFDKMVLKSNSEISIQILAKRYNVGIRKIKEQIAIEDPDYKFVVDFELPNSTIKTIDHIRFCVERGKAKKESKDEDSYFSILSKKLGVPVKLLKTDDYRIHLKQVGTPHKSRVPSKPPFKK